MTDRYRRTTRHPVLRYAIWILANGGVFVLLAVSVVPRYQELQAFPLLPQSGVVITLMLEIALAVGLIGVANFLFWTSPYNNMAVLMAVFFLCAGAIEPRIVISASYPTYSPHAVIIAPFAFTIAGISLVALFALLYTFPDGKFYPRWTIITFIGWIAVHVIWVTLPNSRFNIYSRESYLPEIVPSIIHGVAWISTGIVAQVMRYRRVADETERLRMRWVVLGMCVACVGGISYVGLHGYGMYLTQEGMITSSTSFTVWMIGKVLIQILGMSLIPGYCWFVAIFQYRLWEIDTLVSRTLVFIGLVLAIIIVYVLVVSAISVIFATDNLLVSLVATGVVAVSFQGIRDRIQRAVNRLMFGQRDEPQLVLTTLAQQLQTAVLPQDLLDMSAASIAAALKLPYVAITLQHGVDLRLQSRYGEAQTSTETIPLIHQNIVIGDLVVGQRSAGEALNAADHAVLQSIAQQLSAVVYAVRLQNELQTARTRLVNAREQERRRLRHDLNDGLGPTLASQPLKIDIAMELLPEHPALAHDLLADIKQEMQGLVGDVRRVIRELQDEGSISTQHITPEWIDHAR